MAQDKNEEKRFENEEMDKKIPDDLFLMAMANSFDAFMITTAHKGYPIVFVNKAFTQLTGYSMQECRDRSPSFLQGPKTDRAVLDRLSKNLRDGVPFHGEAVNYRKDGTEFIMEWKAIAYKNDQGVITHYFAIQRDVTATRSK